MESISGFKADYKILGQEKKTFVLAFNSAEAIKLVAAKFPGAAEIVTEEIPDHKLLKRVRMRMLYLAGSLNTEAAKKVANRRVAAYFSNKQTFFDMLAQQSPQLLPDLINPLFEQIYNNGNGNGHPH